MNVVLLILAATFFFWAGSKQWQKHWKITKQQNLDQKNWFKMGWNYFSNLLWPAYLLIFGAGLICNNLFWP